MILYDPGYRPAPALPISSPVKIVQPGPSDQLDLEILNYLRNQPKSVPIWKMINSLASAHHPPNRFESRKLKKEILSKITNLTRSRFLRRIERKYLSLC
jgi:hypothetical protein